MKTQIYGSLVPVQVQPDGRAARGIGGQCEKESNVYQHLVISLLISSFNLKTWQRVRLKLLSVLHAL